MRERVNGDAAEKPASADKPARTWVTRAEAVAAAALACIFVAWVSVAVVQQRRAGRDIQLVPAKQDAGETLIDLNDAGVPELMLLPGIGRVRAERLVNWRTEHGPFHTLEDARKAAGMSARDLEGIRGMVTLGEGRPEPAPDRIPPETDSE